MRIVFMGTPDFAAVILQALLDAGHEICGVATQPDKAKDRGKKIQFTPTPNFHTPRLSLRTRDLVTLIMGKYLSNFLLKSFFREPFVLLQY